MRNSGLEPEYSLRILESESSASTNSASSAHELNTQIHIIIDFFGDVKQQN